MGNKNPNPTGGSPHPSHRATLFTPKTHLIRPRGHLLPGAEKVNPMGEGHLPSAEKGGGQRSAMSLPAADVMLEKAELAVKLKVHVRTIENWQRDGFLPYIKIGNAVWFYWPDVIQHLLANFRVLAPLATEKISSTPHPVPLPDRGGEGMKSRRAQ